ncbi:hypothetical protein P3T73_09780 [Kiritimatiellota bacterium B12222]|nr:hypothetical protein P3T73_09780 [Kiritimatiellota bacterium B12222]
MKTPMLDAFNTTLETQKAHWVAPYEKPVESDTHQFLLFLKPEVTAQHENVDVGGILKMTCERLNHFDVSVHAIRILPAAYLAKNAIMDQHYGVINAISKNGEAALTEQAREKLHEVFAEDLANGAQVLGGHQFLQAQPEFTPLSLCTLSDNLGTTKLGGGSYCMRLKLDGELFLVLNPFHAFQLVPFTTPGRAIIAAECRSNQDWDVLRTQLTGSTDPSKAEAGSIRAELLAHKDVFNLKDVNQGSNGVHLSAGPLEGMVELQRFFTDHDKESRLELSDTIFGAQLLAAGISEDRLKELASNPELTVDGQNISAFDLTEEVNAAESVKRLI